MEKQRVAALLGLLLENLPKERIRLVRLPALGSLRVVARPLGRASSCSASTESAVTECLALAFARGRWGKSWRSCYG